VQYIRKATRRFANSLVRLRCTWPVGGQVGGQQCTRYLRPRVYGTRCTPWDSTSTVDARRCLSSWGIIAGRRWISDKSGLADSEAHCDSSSPDRDRGHSARAVPRHWRAKATVGTRDRNSSFRKCGGEALMTRVSAGSRLRASRPSESN
jgi:hypothetical protein